MKPTFLKFVFTVFFIFFISCAISSAGDIRFGVNPYANPSVVYNSFKPLADYLSRESGSPVRIVIASNYVRHINNIVTQKIDIAFAGPSPYVKIKDKYGGIEALAKIKMFGETNDRMVIITHNKSGINNLMDIRGKTFVFGNHQSFGSHFMPRYVLHTNGLKLKDLAGYDCVGNHDNVVLSVLHKDFDAGGMREDIFLKYRNDSLKVIYGPVRIPPHVIISRTSLDEGIKKKLQKALLELRDEIILKRINTSMEGFLPVSDDEFEMARTVIDYMESR